MVGGRVRAATAAILSALMLASAATASAGMIDQPGPLRKLSRGVANTCTGIFELPYTIMHVGKDEGVVPAMSWGVVHGMRKALLRTGLGIADVVTFPVRYPTGDYESLITPEFFPNHAEYDS